MIQNIILSAFEDAASQSEQHTSQTGTYKPVHQAFERLMITKGFKFLGKGMYSSAWEFDGKFYKINSNVNGAYDGFYGWMLACMELPDNPALPKFGEMIQYGSRYCVEIEYLTEQNRIMCIDTLHEQMQVNPDLAEAVLLALKVAVNCCDFSGSNRIFDGCMPGDISMPIMVDWLDIHSANVRVRNGVLVLNDPVARLGQSIKPTGVQYATYARAA